MKVTYTAVCYVCARELREECVLPQGAALPYPHVNRLGVVELCDDCYGVALTRAHVMLDELRAERSRHAQRLEQALAQRARQLEGSPRR